jgi:prepilin-type N-terminal cleavage/methylation domain-containing protein
MRRCGMTLLELMIALSIGVVLITFTMTLMVAQSRAMNSSKDVTDLQDNARVALDLLAKEVRGTGYLLPVTYLAVRVENNCGGSATGGPAPAKVDIDTTTNAFTIPGSSGNSIDAQGNIKGALRPIPGGTIDDEGCPNGSDRITTFMRPQSNFVQGNSGPGNSLQLDIICPGRDCTRVFSNAGILGTDCNSAGTESSNTITMCDAANPFSCYPVRVTPKTGSGCSACNNDICTLDVYSQPSNNPFQSVVPWTAVGGKNGASFQSWAFKTWQLMDLDGDGSTELVYSTDVNQFISQPGAAQTATWIPVANDIDDLQISYALSSNPTVFKSKSLWNMVGPGNGTCTEDANNDCMYTRFTANDMPIAMRITIIARTHKKEFGGSADKAIVDGRAKIEDNDPVLQPYSNVTGNWTTGVCYGLPGLACDCGQPPPNGGGGTALGYATCSGNGNAQGFRRRVFTQIVGLRNFGSRTFN